MNITTIISAKNLSDLFITAVEGGCTYWCEEMVFTKDGKAASYMDAETFEGDSWSVLVKAEDFDEATITPEAMAVALGALPQEAAMLVTENPEFDAATADALVQQAAYAEIVFG